MGEISRPTRTITRRGAETAVLGALEAAAARGVPVSVAVTDQAGHLMAFARMDDAPVLTVQLAQDKAHTAIQFGVATHQWYDLIKDDPALLVGIPPIPRLVVFGGGLPLRSDGCLIGGVGVSGGSTDDDVAIAEAALVALVR